MPIKLRFGKKEKPKKTDKNKKDIDLEKILNKRIFIPKTIKLAGLGLLVLLILFSTVTAYNNSQKPTSETETNTVLTYSQNGNYNYRVYLKNNTVYNGKEFLLPNEGKIFRKLVDHINASFSYNFQISKQSDITGSYNFVAILETAYWTKTFTLVNTTNFNTSNRNNYAFSEIFPINYGYYENVIKQINNETGVSVQNPSLIIRCNLQLTADTGEEKIPQTFSPSINISLRQDTIDISDTLSLRRSGSKTEQETIKYPEVTEETNKWTYITIALIVLTTVFFAVTKTEKKQLTQLQKKVKRIKKKYGEWMIEIKKAPSKEGADVFPVNSMEDLVKLSEEMGKPIIFYDSSVGSFEKYEFYVLEEYNHYVYTIS